MLYSWHTLQTFSTFTRGEVFFMKMFDRIESFVFKSLSLVTQKLNKYDSLALVKNVD